MRKRLLIYPKFQLGLIAANTLLMGSGLGFAGVQIIRAVNAIKSEGVSAGLSASHPYFKFLEMESQTILSYLIVAFIFSCALSSVVTLLISNRLAGPIVRLREYFRGIAHTSKPPKTEIFFRKGDFFDDLPAIINNAFGKLHPRSRHDTNVRHLGSTRKKAA